MSFVDVTRASILVGIVCAMGACSSSTTTDTADGGGGSDGGGTTDLTPGAQTPPQAGADVEAWIKAGSYKGWHCEQAPHASRSPSPHGMNRICSNDLTSSFSGTGERPAGSAAVKELYDEAGQNVVGVAVYLKTKAASAGGANWYWYERVPLDSDAPHDADGVVADGLGATGAAKEICVGCHAGAGSDDAHTPTAGASDQVYTQVK